MWFYVVLLSGAGGKSAFLHRSPGLPPPGRRLYISLIFCIYWYIYFDMFGICFSDLTLFLLVEICTKLNDLMPFGYMIHFGYIFWCVVLVWLRNRVLYSPRPYIYICIYIEREREMAC